MTERFDAVIVGAGIAGASLAAFAAPHARVLLLEMEAQPGYHTTGRSAAFYAETYGGPGVQPLTSASRAFLESPPAIFEGSLLAPRGCLHVADVQGLGALEALAEDFTGSGVAMRWLDAQERRHRLPFMREAVAAIEEPGCTDIDVARLHQGLLRMARAAGATVLTGAELLAAERADGVWRIETRTGPVEAPLIANAAGAWADDIAARSGVPPLGIAPMRRTVVVIEVEPAARGDLPLIIDARGRFYFKPDTGRLWLSPHDETPSPPCDAQPDELDVATVVDLFERAADWPIRRVVHSWAGLRSFAPDRLPVLGFDPGAQGFFWCAGQGGFGIQTAPAAGRLAAALLLGGDADWARSAAIDPARYAPDRFR